MNSVVKFCVFAYNDRDDKLVVFSSASFPECCAVAQSLYSASDLEFKILNSEGQVLVSFYKPVTK